MNKQDYLAERNRQLSSAMHYHKIGEHVLATITNTVNSILKHLVFKHTFRQKQLEYLPVAENPNPEKCTIHKNPKKRLSRTKLHGQSNCSWLNTLIIFWHPSPQNMALTWNLPFLTAKAYTQTKIIKMVLKLFIRPFTCIQILISQTRNF